MAALLHYRVTETMSPPPLDSPPRAGSEAADSDLGEERRRDDRRRGRLNAELLDGILEGNIDEVKRKLEAGASVNATCRPTRTTALHLAVASGHEDVVTLLLAKGADSRCRDVEGRQAVHLAAAVGDPVVLRLLLDHDPAIVNSHVAAGTVPRDNESLDSWSHDHDSVAGKIPQVTEGATPLHLATQRLLLPCVIILLGRAAMVDLQDRRGLTPLDVVGEITKKGSNSQLDLNALPITSKVTDPKTNSSRNRVVLIREKRKKCSRRHFIAQKSFIRVPSISDYPLHHADFPINHIDPILKTPLDTHTSYSSKIPSEAQQIVSSLIAKGAKFPKPKEQDGVQDQMTVEVNCLHTAVELEDLRLIEYLLDNGACQLTWNSEGLTPLHLAVVKQILEPLKLLLDKKSSTQVVNARDIHGRTPLHLAVAVEWFSGVSLLLEAGADVKVTSNDNQTVMHLAAAKRESRLLEELLTIPEAVNMIDARNRLHETPLCWAVSMGHLACVEVLLAKGADVTIKLPGKSTLLHLCASNDHHSVLERLLRYPRMAMFKNSRTNEQNGGMTALHLAALKGFVSCVKILLASGSNVHEVTVQHPYRKSTALHLAAMKGHSKVVEAIVNFDRSTLSTKNEDGWYPLHVAARFSNEECLRIMLFNAANLSDTILDSDGNENTAFEIIVHSLLDPVTFLNEIFDLFIQVNEHPLNSSKCEIKLKYNILQPLGPEWKQLLVLDSLLNCTKFSVQENLLLHPLVETFLFLKWKKLRVLFFVILAIYVVFTASLTTLVMSIFVLKCDYYLCESIQVTLFLVSDVTLWISFYLITLQELVQAFRMQHYFKYLETWIKWFSFLLTFVFIFSLHLPELYELRMATVQMVPVTVLLSWLDLLFLLSRWPSSLGFYIVMFFAVASKVIKVLAAFLFVTLGFMFAFMIHFRGSDQFSDVWRSFTKVMVMTFEFDYERMFGSTQGLHAAVGRAIFLYFMVLMSIVLMNLLVGLAVSDIAILEKQGRSQRLAKQIDFLGMLEMFVYNKGLLACCPKKLVKAIKRFRAVDCELKFAPVKRPQHKLQCILSESMKQSVIDNIIRRKKAESVFRKNPDDSVDGDIC